MRSVTVLHGLKSSLVLPATVFPFSDRKITMCRTNIKFPTLPLLVTSQVWGQNVGNFGSNKEVTPGAPPHTFSRRGKGGINIHFTWTAHNSPHILNLVWFTQALQKALHLRHTKNGEIHKRDGLFWWMGKGGVTQKHWTRDMPLISNCKTRYETYLIPGETLIPGGREEGSVSPWYWICVISMQDCHFQ